MNGTNYLLDTCFILRYFGQEDDALQIIEDNNLQASECAYSIITHAETLGYPLNEIDEHNLTSILADFQRLPISDDVLNKTIAIRKKHKIKLPDAFILATAKVHELTLLTFDEKLQRLASSL